MGNGALRSTTPPLLPPNLLSTPPPSPQFAELGNLKVALGDVHFLDLMNALAECGITFTKPPNHFKSLIENCKLRRFQFLEPENVRKELLVRN
jgi:sacsin